MPPAPVLDVPEPAAESAVAADEMLAFLADPALYAHRPARVDVVQTHISYVALAPPLVFKVKKPLDLGFLDYSTLERRRHFCEEEVRLNRRLCADVYEAVVPITRQGGRLAWGGTGTPVEVAVRMRHLDPAGFLDARLDAGTLATSDLDHVADVLAAFYRAQRPTAEAAAWGRADRLRLSTDENAAQTERFVGTLLSQPAHEALRYATERFFSGRARLLSRRRAEGRVVDGHGDLRLEHVHLMPGHLMPGQPEPVCVYDCVEFNERLRLVDVANDVAFLAMDLDARGRPDLARHVAERLAAALGDPELLDVLDFYKGYRATVRGKVEGMRSEEPEVPAAERAASAERARAFFRLALGTAVAGSRPLVVAVMGRTGTGKSTLARALADALGWEAVASDVVRKASAGVPLFERGDAAERAALYTPARTDETYAALTDAALDRAARGLSTVLDATFATRRHRDALRAALAAAGVGHRFVELVAPDSVLRERLAAREDVTDEASDARLSDFAALSARFEPPTPLEDPDHVTADAAVPVEDCTVDALRHLVRLSG